jgi:hypothetical protein
VKFKFEFTTTVGKAKGSAGVSNSILAYSLQTFYFIENMNYDYTEYIAKETGNHKIFFKLPDTNSYQFKSCKITYHFDRIHYQISSVNDSLSVCSFENTGSCNITINEASTVKYILYANEIQDSGVFSERNNFQQVTNNFNVKLWFFFMMWALFFVAYIICLPLFILVSITLVIFILFILVTFIAIFLKIIHDEIHDNIFTRTKIFSTNKFFF